MDPAEIGRRVRNVIKHLHSQVDESNLQDDKRFVEDLGMDSTQSIELIAAFEAEFDIEIPEEEGGAVKTIGGAVQFIQERVS